MEQQNKHPTMVKGTVSRKREAFSPAIYNSIHGSIMQIKENVAILMPNKRRLQNSLPESNIHKIIIARIHLAINKHMINGLEECSKT